MIPADSLWAGKTLKELDFGKRYGVHVASIIRGTHRINIPGGDSRIFPSDTLQVIGTDEQLSAFASLADKMAHYYSDDDFMKREMNLKQFVVVSDSPFCGHTIRESGIRNKYRCLVVGIELKSESALHKPDVNLPLMEGDVVWVVGEQDDLKKFFMVNESASLKMDESDE